MFADGQFQLALVTGGILVVGIFFGLVGIVVGPFVGAVAAEMSAGRGPQQAGRSGYGVWLGMLLGTAAKVRVFIESRDQDRLWSTIGVSEDIIEASWQALADSFQYKLANEKQIRSGLLPEQEELPIFNKL